MSAPAVRTVTFGGSSVRIESAGRPARRLVEFLFRDTPTQRGPSPQTTVHVRAEGARGPVSIHHDHRLCYRGTSGAEAARTLMEVTSLSLAERSRGGLLFHAAAVGWEGDVVLLPGRAGAGKTTLAAWLVGKGWRYLGDELAYVPHGSHAVQGLGRPLNIKRSGRGTFGRLTGLRTAAADSLTSPVAKLVRVSQPAPARTRSDLSVIVFPRFRPDGDAQTAPLSPAAAGLRLMENLLNARNLPGHGFAAVADLARRIRAFEVVYSAFEQIGPWFDSLRAGHPGRVRGRRS